MECQCPGFTKSSEDGYSTSPVILVPTLDVPHATCRMYSRLVGQGHCFLQRLLLLLAGGHQPPLPFHPCVIHPICHRDMYHFERMGQGKIYNGSKQSILSKSLAEPRDCQSSIRGIPVHPSVCSCHQRIHSPPVSISHAPDPLQLPALQALG